MYACMTPVGFDTSDKFENHWYKDSWCTVGLHCPRQNAFGSSLKSTRRSLLIQCEKRVDGVEKLEAMLLPRALEVLLSRGS